MLAPLKGVGPALRFRPPAKNPWLMPVAPFGSWLYVTFFCGIRRIETRNIERLVRQYQSFQEGQARVIVAFRHVGVEDGPVVYRLMTGIVGREARKLGLRLRRPARGYFLFGRDVPEWAGHFLGWFLPLLGAISVVPGRYDSQSITMMRRYLTDMPHPIGLAPEGQVTYHNERVARLEPGTAQLGLWGLEDLRKQARNEEVVIVPVCTSYHYREKDRAGLGRLMAGVERHCGLPPLEGDSNEKLYVRVMRATRHLLDTAERHYARFHHVSFPASEEDGPTAGLQERMRRVCEAALSLAERFFGIAAKGDFVQRVFSIRQAGLAWMFREDIGDPDALPPLDRALADRVAIEAWIVHRHLELVDLFEYFRADYLSPDSGIDRFAESIVNLQDLVNRLEGGNISGRKNPFRKIARIVVNEPIPVSPYWQSYRENRRKAVAELTQAVFESFRAVAESGAGG